MQIAFVHPTTKHALERDEHGTLSCDTPAGKYACPLRDGCYDFAADNPDVWHTREVYDEFYAKMKPEDLTISGITASWFDRTLAWRRTLLESLGDLKGKRILVLGNGASCREFYFLSLGAEVVFTDLSIVAVQHGRHAFLSSEFATSHLEHIEFHAVDATKLPFCDGSFDVIYGTKFVAFLPDLPKFYSEVSRCLKNGGKCRFVDDAYSPAWDAVRRTVMLPVKTRFLWKRMSELDRVRSACNPRSGFGFHKDKLEPFLSACGFTRLVFIKQFFFLRIAQMMWGKTVRYNPKYLRLARPAYLLMLGVDNLLAGTRWLERNALSLIHGFDK